MPRLMNAATFSSSSTTRIRMVGPHPALRAPLSIQQRWRRAKHGDKCVGCGGARLRSAFCLLTRALHQVSLPVDCAPAEALDGAVGPADLDLVHLRRGPEAEGEPQVALGEVAGAAADHPRLPE